MRFDIETHTVHAGGRQWHADPRHTEITDLIHNDWHHRLRSCVVPFESGWSASIIWGSGTYSTNNGAWKVGDPFIDEPSCVEVGILDRTGELRMKRGDDSDDQSGDVEGYVDDADLVALLDRLATLPTEFDYGVRPPTPAELRDKYETVRKALGKGHQLPEWIDDE